MKERKRKMDKALCLTAACVIALMLVMFAACGGGADTPDPVPPLAATPTPAPSGGGIPSPTPGPAAPALPPEAAPIDPLPGRPLYTSPDGQARVWRDFAAAGLHITNLNPHMAGGSVNHDTLSLISGAFIRRDQQSTMWAFVPETATELPTSNEDGTVWTIRLRQGLTWSNGTPVNAHCFDFSFYHLLHPRMANLNATGWWATVQVANARAFFLGVNAPAEGLPVVTWEDVGFRVIDGYTIEFTLESRPLPISIMQFFSGFTMSPVYRERYLAGMNVAGTATTYRTNSAEFTTMPVFGPYRVEEIVIGQFWSLRRNDEWPTAAMFGREVWSWRNIELASTREQMFIDGHIDRLVVTAENYYTWRDDPRTHPGFGGTMWNLYVNTLSEEVPALRDINFRRALSYGTDRVLLASAAFRVFSPAEGFMTRDAIVGDIFAGETMSYRDTEWGQAAFPPNYGYDPERALMYFDRAFANNGNRRIEIIMDYFEGQESMRRNAEILQEMWISLFGADRLGVALRSGPPTAIYDSGANRTHQIFTGSTGQNNVNIWASMQTFSDIATRPLTTFQESPLAAEYAAEFNRLFHRTMSGDLLHATWQERSYALMRMEQLLYEYLPLIPIWQNSNWQIFSPRTQLVQREFTPGGIGFPVRTMDPMVWVGTPEIAMP